MKRILIVDADPELTLFHRRKLEGAGAAVETIASMDEALPAIAGNPPDAILIDLVMHGLESAESIQRLRGAAPSTIIALPTPLRRLSHAAVQAGATVLPDESDSGSDDPLLRVLGLEAGATNSRDGAASVLSGAPDLVNATRRCLHASVQEHHNRTSTGELLRQIHLLSERARIAGLRPAHRLTSALESLVYEFYNMPEQVNASTLRTVGQAIDFLSTLLEEKNLVQIKDPSATGLFAVDDEAESREAITAAMALARLPISCAEDPEAALAVLAEQKFDLIFLDVGLPGMSGFDLCQKVRALPIHEKTPVIFLTGMATFQNRAQSSLSGGNDFVGKPFNLEELGVKALTWIFKGQLGLRQ